jgi:uncharacterized protein YcaQ
MPKPDALNGAGPDPIPLTREIARRFLVLRHFLAPPRTLPAGPAGVLAFIDRIGSLQFDPIDVAGRNHDLVLLARVAGYRRTWTDALLYEDRALFEAYNKMLSILPTAELPWFRIAWDRARIQHEGGSFDEHAPLMEELLKRIRETGPMSSRDVEPRAAIDWYWRPTNQVRAILEALGEAGILGIARRDGNVRVYDLIERLFPAELLAERPSVRDQFRHKLLSRYRAHGLLGGTGPAELWHGTYPRAELGGEDGLPMGTPGRNALHAELVASGGLLPVEIDGVRGRRYMVGGERDILDQAVAEVATGAPPGGVPAGVAFLAPLDPLAWDRDFLRACFDFDYLWEVYVPAPKRRWGYYVLPLLYGDRFAGRIELRADRKAGVLRILGAWWEDGFDPLADEAFAGALGEALEAHRSFAGMRQLAWPRTARHRALAAAVRRFEAGDVAREVPA